MVFSQMSSFIGKRFAHLPISVTLAMILPLTGMSAKGQAPPSPVLIATMTNLVAVPDSSLVAGQPITLIATVSAVSGSGVPTGTVTFTDPAGGKVSEPLVAGKAVYSGKVPSAGMYSLFASYGGGSGFAPSQSATITRTVAAPSGQLAFAPAMANFGSVTVGSTSQQLTVTATNTTDAPVKYDGYSNVATFGFQSGTCGPVNSGTMLGANSSCTFKVTFSPTALGTDIGNFEIKTSDGNVVYQLAGLAVPGKCLDGSNCISGQVAQPVATPEVVPLSTPTTVTVTAAVNGTDLVNGSVNLVRFDQYGALVGSAAQMFDDGTHGDEAAGDGIYTAQVVVSKANKQSTYFRVAAAYLENALVESTLSETVEVLAANPLGSAEFRLYSTTMEAAMNKYLELIKNGADPFVAQASTIAWLNLQVGVGGAGAVQAGGTNIWIQFVSGISGVLAVTDEIDTSLASGSSASAMVLHAKASDSAALRDAVTSLPTPLTVVRFSPSYSETKLNGGTYHEETGPISDLLVKGSNSSCPTAKPRSFLDGDASVDNFKTLGQSNIVLVSGHGDAGYGLIYHTYYDDLTDSIYPHLWSEAQPFIDTGTTFDHDSVFPTIFSRATLVDLLLGRLFMVFREPLHPTDVLAITPAFIRKYYKPDLSRENIIYAGSCDSLVTDAMAEAFLKNGATTYYGYTAIVNTDFAYKAGIDLFTQLKSGLTTSAAQSSLSSFSDSDPASLKDIDHNQDDKVNYTTFQNPFDGKTVVITRQGNKAPDGNFTSLDIRQTSDALLPMCTPPPPPPEPKAEFIFDLGEPGNMSVAINHVVQNFNGLQQNQTESLGFAELPQGETYTLGVEANGGFAEYTINLPAGFVFSDGTSTVTSYIISFSGPNFYTFKAVGAGI